MNRNELRNVFPQTPAHFIDRMDDVLAGIEAREHNAKKKPVRLVLAAVILVLLLAGSAVAIGSAMGVFDFMKRVAEPIEPLQGAEKWLESGLAYADGEFGSIEVVEGIYSGRSCKIVLKAVLKDGYEPSFPSVAFLNTKTPGAGSLDMQEGENGGIQFMLEEILEEDTPEVLECEVDMMFGMGGKATDNVKLRFDLRHAAGEKAKLVPQNAGERWEILSGSITRNEFSMVFDIEFRYTAETGEDMGVDIRAFDENGNQYDSGDTSYGDRGLPVIGESMVCRQIAEIQSAEEMPDKIEFRPKVIGEDKWLDGIVCEID